jgi:pimeloyl-ACP methyl ester carboxylesterase
MQATGISTAHVCGLSLGGAVGLWLAAKHPGKVQSLSIHSAWSKSDPFVKVVLEGFQVMARALGSVPEMVIQAILPWCFTPELYAARPEFIQAVSDFVRSRPAQPIEAFVEQSNAAIAHDAAAQLGRITAPTQITFGDRDQVTSTRFADQLTTGIRNSELVIFQDCAHAPLYEKIEEFNQKTLQFLQRQAGAVAT